MPPSRRLRIAVWNHASKAAPFIAALAAAGHEFCQDINDDVDAMLMDLDPPYLAHAEMLDRYSEQNAKIFLYPHGGGGPILSYDGLWEPDKRVFANFVMGVGHAEYLRRLDYPAETHVIGWPYCDILPFQPREAVKTVLFAPTHPNGDGSMTSYQRDMNTDVFRRLLQTPFKLTVRHIGTLEQNGLWIEDGVEYIQGSLVPAVDQIDQTDAVVAADGTFPTLAVARGVPTVVYGQGVVALGVPDEEPIVPNRLHLYQDYSRFPFDVADGDLETLVRTAARSDAPVAAWKRRFIGKKFDPLEFVEIFERLAVGGPTPPRIDATRARTTLAFADELAERPELLRAYVEAYGPEDDASLILWTPAASADDLLEQAETAIERAGLDGEALPDILLAPLPGSPAVDQALAARADALLSEWPSAGRIGALPRFAARVPA
jgi:hypothetical protein